MMRAVIVTVLEECGVRVGISGNFKELGSNGWPLVLGWEFGVEGGVFVGSKIIVRDIKLEAV